MINDSAVIYGMMRNAGVRQIFNHRCGVAPVIITLEKGFYMQFGNFKFRSKYNDPCIICVQMKFERVGMFFIFPKLAS